MSIEEQIEGRGPPLSIFDVLLDVFDVLLVHPRLNVTLVAGNHASLTKTLSCKTGIRDHVTELVEKKEYQEAQLMNVEMKRLEAAVKDMEASGAVQAGGGEQRVGAAREPRQATKQELDLF